MKNNQIFRRMMFFAMAVMPLFAFSQVKQVFQVLDFDTQKPLEGATNSLYGQTVTTNAKGVAVAALPADKMGAPLLLNAWYLKGYQYLGRVPSSFYQDFQTKDTIKFYMAEEGKYRQAVDEVFGKLFRFQYKDVVEPTMKSFMEDYQANPENANALASRLIEAAFTPRSVVRNCYSDATRINRYDYYEYEKPQFSDVLALLRSGDVNRAVSMTKSHINTTDNSRSNMEWIEFYRALRDLETDVEDDTPVSEFTGVLYKNHYSPYEGVNYVQNLLKENEYDKADSVSRIERPNNRYPMYETTFAPSFFRYLVKEDNPAKLKTTAENLLDLSLDIYSKYPCSRSMTDVIWIYKNMYFAYSVLGDSAQATRVIDSSMAYLQRWLTDFFPDIYNKNQRKISVEQYITDVVNYNVAFLPQTTLYQLYDEIYDAAKENYGRDTTSLFLQTQLAECALQWLENTPQLEEAAEKRMEVIQQLVNLNFKLSDEFPDYYAVVNVQAASQLLAQNLLNGSTSVQLLNAFRQYERSFDVINARVPKAFIGIYMHLNSMVESYLTATQQFALTSELSSFTDRLISIREDYDAQRIIVAKAENANQMAESLYEGESYEEAVGYYLKSNELYEKAMEKDVHLWIPYLRNYLQMGDAHLNQNQYDKAIMTYQKILDFEPQIPAALMPQYTTMKGSVSYYVGDVYKAIGEVKRAEKEYKTAEKLYNKAIAMGDSSAYLTLGEMYWGKAVLYAQQKNVKKCRQMVEKSVNYYEKVPMDRPLSRYEQAKSTLEYFYEQNGETDKYYANMVGLVDFYRKFAEYEEKYAIGLVDHAEKLINSDRVSNEDALVYAKDILSGLSVLADAGHDVELPYLRAMFYLAKVAVANDSVEEAIVIYRRCAEMSENLYADTAMTMHKGNMVDIYSALLQCYEKMADEMDTAHAELWRYRAVDTRDSLIDLMKELNDDGDVRLTYRTAVLYKDNAMGFYELEMFPSAQDYLDKSNELLLKLYNSEYKEEVEEDLILNYYIKGYLYKENGNTEKAIENLRVAVDYGEKANTSEGVSRYYFMAVNDLIELLEKDKAANAEELGKLVKTQKALKKLF